MIPYYLPNLSISKFVRSALNSTDTQRIEGYFRDYTKKKHILVTGSARAALYLAYKAVGRNGEVITSPLTCFSALDPVVESGNSVRFSDISLTTLNMNEDLVLDQLGESTLAIQVIHLGGVSMDVKKLKEKLYDGNVILIEDCAQGFGAQVDGTYAGSHADVSCFSLIKNFYGIGGGILATDDRNLFDRAKALQDEFDLPPPKLVYFRIVRNILESYRTNHFGEWLYRLLMTYRTRKLDGEEGSFTKSLHKPHMWYIKIASQQIRSLHKYHSKRINNARILIEKLKQSGLMENYSGLELKGPSFVKLYVYDPSFKVPDFIEKLDKSGIEAKHLEQKYGSCYQERADRMPVFSGNESLLQCTNYFKVHDHMLTLPLHEKMQEKQMDRIVETMKRLI